MSGPGWAVEVIIRNSPCCVCVCLLVDILKWQLERTISFYLAGHNGPMCNADQCGSMYDKILSIDTNVSHWSLLRSILDQCKRFDRTLIHIVIDRHCTLIHHVLRVLAMHNHWHCALICSVHCTLTGALMLRCFHITGNIYVRINSWTGQ